MTVLIESLDNNVVTYYCTECDLHEFHDIGDLLTDDCALDIDIGCKECEDSTILYVLKCKNAALAKDLNAKLEVLRLNRKSGVLKDDDKISQQGNYCAGEDG